MTKQEFLAQANGRARARVMGEQDYDDFCVACADAVFAAQSGKPYHASNDGGGVANAYGSTTTTPLWGVITTPDGKVRAGVGRVAISGRSVPCAYHGGERAYARDFANGEVGDLKV